MKVQAFSPSTNIDQKLFWAHHIRRITFLFLCGQIQVDFNLLHSHFTDTDATLKHYSDVILIAMASQITDVSIVYSIVCSGQDQRKHQSSTSLAFVRGIRRSLVDSPDKWPVTQKMYPFNDVIMGFRHNQPNESTESCFHNHSKTQLYSMPWWRHAMETLSASLALCEGNPPVTGGSPHKGPVMTSVDIFFDVNLSKLLISSRVAAYRRRHDAHVTSQ